MIPYRGLPPWPGGGAYAPRTWRICNLEVRSQLWADQTTRQKQPYYMSPVLSGWRTFGFKADFGFTAGYCDLWLHRGCALGRTDTASGLGRYNNPTRPKGKVRYLMITVTLPLVSVAQWHSARWAWNGYQPGLGSIPRPGRINCLRITGVHALRLISRTCKRVWRCPL